jgi:Ca-activated chloride channel family protein
MVLKKMINELQIGMIDPNGTVLARGMITAASRLKNSQAKSKVMILLTDGEPSEQDLDTDIGIKIAKELGIKVYTIGIGSDRDEMMIHPFHGWMQKPRVNTELLAHIAQETGGKFFMAHNAADMRTIYHTIDQLERTRHDVPMFSKYFDLITPVGCAALALLCVELGLATFFWFLA